MEILTGTDRRTTCRYPIERRVRYHVAGGANGHGTGRTVNISSHGVLFTTTHRLTPGETMELFISWPARLHGECPLQLVAKGRVVRYEKAPANLESSIAAIEIRSYEFRTEGLPGARRAWGNP